MGILKKLFCSHRLIADIGRHIKKDNNGNIIKDYEECICQSCGKTIHKKII